MADEPDTQEAGGTQFDDPNRQAVGVDPAWVEGTGGGQEPKGGLDSMTKAELLDHAKKIGAHPANSDMTKDELRASIDAHGEAEA